MKIIIWDIETSPLLVTSWGLFKPYLTHDNIERDGNILTACWKVVGEKEVHSLQVDHKRPTVDKPMLVKLVAALSEADVLVAHNGDAFDLPWLNSRLTFNGLSPLPPLKTIDTYKVVKKHFRFSSNRLDHLGRYLGLGKKIKTDYELWKEVMAGSRKALDQMVTYNKQDVELLEKVYLRLRPFMEHHPNHSLFVDGRGKCPTCGVGILQKRGTRMMASTLRQRFHCQNEACGAWSYGTRKVSGTEVAG